MHVKLQFVILMQFCCYLIYQSDVIVPLSSKLKSWEVWKFVQYTLRKDVWKFMQDLFFVSFCK